MRRPKIVPARAISAFHCAFNRPAPAWQVTISRAIGVAPVPTAACRVANLPIVYPGIPLQRCWARKIRNVLDKVRKPDRNAVKAGLHAIMNAANRTVALGAARRFADAWENTYPKAVACLRNDLDDLLTCFRYPTQAERRRVRTINAIERRFLEVRRRTRPTGTFQDRTSMDRILFVVFSHENKAQGTSTPFSLT